MEVQEFIMHL